MDIDVQELNLKNILNQIRPDLYTSIFTEQDRYKLIEYVLEIINDYVEENTNIVADPDFDDIIYEDISDIIYEQYENYLYPEYYFTYNDTVENELTEIIDFAFEIFYICFIPERSLEITSQNTFKNPDSTKNTKNKEDITKIITYLKSKPQPEQRTNEWYEFRHNLITASNAYKAFESDAMKNQLIYEKCQPIKTVSGSSDSQNQSKQVNINTPFHWGQKYEPVSVMIYEYMYNTKIGDFGCIKHDKYFFLGASPDGINIDPNSEKYGVMLEIKNIVNREITGIPKKEYWVQTQLQMETCGLDECDFLETRFIEYENENAFLMDTSNTPDDSTHTNNHQSIEKTAKNEYKGVIMYFANKDGNPFYVYKPMNIKTYIDFQTWEETEMERLESLGYIWIKNLYWRLDCFSCVLIKRNIKWFNENLHFLEELWKTVEYERVHGYAHRAPKSSKKQTKNRIETTTSNKSICLIKINSDTGDVDFDQNNSITKESDAISNDATKTVQLSNSPLTHKPNIMQFFKIRTQSFDESKHNTN
uniref:YqaJ viral recombinase domain-containing protein n=1 Tax=viral metagenome TaxID=1070528 RepID=A0A6C0EES6_9ZZZZ